MTTVFAWSGRPNATTVLNGSLQTVAEGSLQWPVRVGAGAWAEAHFSYLPGLLSAAEVRRLRDLLDTVEAFDTDADTVDGMSSHEFYLERHGGFGRTHLEPLSAKPDADRAVRQGREPLRAALAEIARPIVDRRITPWVLSRYAAQCDTGNAARRCTPCFSIVRRCEARPADRTPKRSA